MGRAVELPLGGLRVRIFSKTPEGRISYPMQEAVETGGETDVGFGGSQEATSANLLEGVHP